MADQPAAPVPAAAPQASIMQYKELIMAFAALLAAGGVYIKPADTTATKVSNEITDAQFKVVTDALKKQHHDMLVLKGFVNELADSHYEEEDHEVAPARRRRGAPAAKPKVRKRRPVMPEFHGSVVREIRHPDALNMNSREIADSIAAMEADEADEAAMEADIRREMRQMMDEGPPELPHGPPF